ncbi:MAG TPA: hypothetical protein VGK67_15040 [Myxococcales bacterium]|jgi:hypothetical protein
MKKARKPASPPPVKPWRVKLPIGLALAAEALATLMLERARLPPGASPWQVAKQLGYVVRRRKLPHGYFGFALNGCAEIVVSSSLDREHTWLAIGHELAETHLLERLPEAWHEQFCDAVAVALMSPVLKLLSLAGPPVPFEEWNAKQQDQLKAALIRKGISKRRVDQILRLPPSALPKRERAIVEREYRAEVRARKTAELKRERRWVKDSAKWMDDRQGAPGVPFGRVTLPGWRRRRPSLKEGRSQEGCSLTLGEPEKAGESFVPPPPE